MDTYIIIGAILFLVGVVYIYIAYKVGKDIDKQNKERPKILYYDMHESKNYIVLSSGCPDHYVLVIDEAGSGGYYVSAKHFTKEELAERGIEFEE